MKSTKKLKLSVELEDEGRACADSVKDQHYGQRLIDFERLASLYEVDDLALSEEKAMLAVFCLLNDLTEQVSVLRERILALERAPLKR